MYIHKVIVTLCYSELVYMYIYVDRHNIMTYSYGELLYIQVDRLLVWK